MSNKRSGCGVSNMRRSEQVGQDGGLLLPPVQPLAGGRLHGLAIARADLADSALDIAVEQLIRVELGRIAGQEEQLDLLRSRLQPVLDLPAAMHRVPVHDEKHLTLDCLISRSQKPMNCSAWKRPSKTMKLISPLLVSAEITLQPKRLPGTFTTVG